MNPWNDITALTIYTKHIINIPTLTLVESNHKDDPTGHYNKMILKVHALFMYSDNT